MTATSVRVPIVHRRVHRPRAPRRATWWPAAVWALTSAGLGGVFGLWAGGGGPAALGASGATQLASIGHICGLLASYLLLLQVLGMARLPWVERSFGQDSVTRWHRWTGFASFHLMVGHVVVALWVATTRARVPWLRETCTAVATMPGMLAATVGFALLVAVVVSSTRAARRRTRYESWHLLHVYAYLGVVFALPHQLWTGDDFAGSTAATVFWWTLWAAATVAVLHFRVAHPLWVSLRHGLRVAQVVPEGDAVVSLHVSGRNLRRLRVEPGQYFVWRFLTGSGWTRGHPLSLSAAPSSAGLRVTVATRGDDGARIAGLRPRTRVLVEGPYGRLTPAARTRPRVAAFAAGSGIAPVMSMLHDNAGSPVVDTLVLRTPRRDVVPLADDIRWLIRETGLRFFVLPGRRASQGPAWLPAGTWHGDGPSAVRALVPDLADHDVLVCGPGPWTRALVADLHAAGAARDAVHVERFDW
jgi:predicted ferric reductase